MGLHFIRYKERSPESFFYRTKRPKMRLPLCPFCKAKPVAKRIDGRSCGDMNCRKAGRRAYDAVLRSRERRKVAPQKRPEQAMHPALAEFRRRNDSTLSE